MGGIGSTRWGGHLRRQTVEEGYRLSTNPLFATVKGGCKSGGWLSWTRTRMGVQETVARIRYVYYPQPAPGRLRFRYTVHRRSPIDMDYVVNLETTVPHFDGVRWWFRCPLIFNKQSCGRRCGKLYLPAGSTKFGCRQCHDLTYQSCQESHEFDRLFRTVASISGHRFEDVKKILAN